VNNKSIGGTCPVHDDGCTEFQVLVNEMEAERKLNKIMFKRVDSLEAKFWAIILMQVGVLGSVATGVVILLLRAQG
jgi:hypothetical protein